MPIKLEYVKVASYTKQTVCHNNDAVRCDAKNCYNCGWNPVVAKMRLDKFRVRKAEG